MGRVLARDDRRTYCSFDWGFKEGIWRSLTLLVHKSKKSSQFVIDRTCVNPYSVGVFACSLSAGGAQ